jgi:hypothetical protein
MTCQEVRKMVETSIFDRTAAERAAFCHHLHKCVECYDFVMDTPYIPEGSPQAVAIDQLVDKDLQDPEAI